MVNHPTGKDSPRTGNRSPRAAIETVGWVFVVFALLFTITALRFDMADEVIVDKLRTNQVFGPISIVKPNTLVTITLTHIPFSRSWTYIEAALENSDGRVLMSFGDEFFHEPAAGGKGPAEFKDWTDLTIAIPSAGEYFLRFWAEGAEQGEIASTDRTNYAIVGVRAETLIGDSWYLREAGWALLILGLLMAVTGNRRLTTARKASGHGRSRALVASSLSLLSLYGFLALPFPAGGKEKLTGDMRPVVLDGTVEKYDARPSVREASFGGPDHMGGGPMAGK